MLGDGMAMLPGVVWEGIQKNQRKLKLIFGIFFVVFTSAKGWGLDEITNPHDGLEMTSGFIRNSCLPAGPGDGGGDFTPLPWHLWSFREPIKSVSVSGCWRPSDHQLQLFPYSIDFTFPKDNSTKVDVKLYDLKKPGRLAGCGEGVIDKNKTSLTTDLLRKNEEGNMTRTQLRASIFKTNLIRQWLIDNCITPRGKYTLVLNYSSCEGEPHVKSASNTLVILFKDTHSCSPRSPSVSPSSCIKSSSKHHWPRQNTRKTP
ncbi:MAG: hypothetical protein NZ480_02505 [Bdellovibrionaceae bacterium]|nr:hypothetical protein [Pseudobdellovibrionaceae bacterium]